MFFLNTWIVQLMVVLTNPAFAVKGAIERAQELAAAIPNSHILNQFANPANPEAHYLTTGPEIWKQTHGKVEAPLLQGDL
ncbi:hypothetical protein ANCDUO_12832 [Ancylostoma duodenale]|uniref:Uncharacterized protein n=1 Tax=Ancylostoma duodenale TaxID=51022 RepID=A0A0C2CKH2_9BILA|nr:hypothetical protein ANCDUO_12832 [Ancylostoma duodenale]